MAKAKISFEVDVPKDVSREEFIDWAKYELGCSPDLSGENPMVFANIDRMISPDTLTIKIE